jgi:hypothetical protein
LYGSHTGSTENTQPGEEMGGEGGAPPSQTSDFGGGEEMPSVPEPEPAGITPESKTKKENLNILLENDDLMSEDSFIDLSRGSNSLGDIEDELDKLLNR